jgi:hypothetical protein
VTRANDAAQVRPATLEDCLYVAGRLRDQDRDELRALGLDDFRHVLAESFKASRWCWCAHIDGRPVAVFGLALIGPTLTAVGGVWMLGTPEIAFQKRSLLRLAPLYIGAMLQASPTLLNRVHAKNTLAVSWLRRSGFVLQPPIPVAPYGELFHPFSMTRHV